MVIKTDELADDASRRLRREHECDLARLPGEGWIHRVRLFGLAESEWRWCTLGRQKVQTRGDAELAVRNTWDAEVEADDDVRLVVSSVHDFDDLTRALVELDLELPPIAKAHADTSGCYQAEGVLVHFSGHAPVQGVGVVDGKALYYRSRGGGWSVEIGDLASTLIEGLAHEDVAELLSPPSPGSFIDDWIHGEQRYVWPDGGWVDAATSIACIAKAIEKWRAR